MRSVDPARQVVVISTHFDDAVFSVGGFLLGVDAPKAIVTVHGGAPGPETDVSSWDQDCGFVTALEAHATRLEEDRRACALLGADQIALPNPDNPYPCRDPMSGLYELIEAFDEDVRVLVPLGTNQPDHTIVRDAVLEVLDKLERRPPWIYADLPYAAALVPDWHTAPARAVEQTLQRLDERLRDLRTRYELTLVHSEAVTEAVWSRKRQAICSYASQLSLVGAMGEVRHLGPLLRFPGAMQRELIWVADPAPTTR